MQRKVSRRAYRYGNESFSSKVRAARYFSELRAGYGLGETIEDVAHVAAVADLLQGHCDRVYKMGCGVKRFFVNCAPRPFQHTTCFWIERIDSTETDFGFAACVDGIGKLNHDSLRRVIRSQVENYKRAKLAEHSGEIFVSELSGERFPIGVAHVDHVTPFDEIVALFAVQERIEIAAELLTVACDAKSEPTWKDPALAARFAAFHANFPLRIVSARENLSTLRRRVS
jgi:hypothetical protein